MKLFVGLLTLLFAILISGVAAYFSIVGLGALFAAAFVPVVIMGSVLEGGKLLSAAWLHANWRNSRVNTVHKSYLIAAITALMLITAIGVYGYLSKGHLDQEAPLSAMTLQIEQRQQKIAQIQADNQRLMARLEQLDVSISTYFKNDQATRGLAARKEQKAERQEIQAAIDANHAEVNKLNDELLPVRQQANEVHAKLGPVKYVADLFGWQDPAAAVRLVILVLMFAFDPLAVVLVLSAIITLGEYFEERRGSRPVLTPPTPIIVPPHFPEPYETHHSLTHEDPMSETMTVTVERDLYELATPPARGWDDMVSSVAPTHISATVAGAFAEPMVWPGAEVRIALPPLQARNEEETILELLERRPDFLQRIIDAVAEQNQSEPTAKGAAQSDHKIWIERR